VPVSVAQDLIWGAMVRGEELKTLRRKKRGDEVPLDGNDGERIPKTWK